MTNKEIVINSIDEWITPIVSGAMQRAPQSLGVLSSIIRPEYVIKAVKTHVGLPMISQYLAHVPDETLPDMALELIDGMIETRKADGPLEIPIIGVKLSPDAFRHLKDILVNNIEQYTELK